MGIASPPHCSMEANSRNKTLLAPICSMVPTGISTKTMEQIRYSSFSSFIFVNLGPVDESGVPRKDRE